MTFIIKSQMIKYLLCSIILITLTQSSTYTITQQFITQGFTDNDFVSWNPFGSSLPLMKFYTCSGHRIFGGYNILVGHPTNPSGITKTWSLLIPHYQVTISMKLYKIDSWLNNTIFFMVDGVTVQVYTFNSTNGGTTDFCGNPTPVTDPINTSYNDLIVSVSFTIPHTSSTLVLKVLSNLASSSGSWGIRDVLITMAACDETCLTCTSSTACTSCDASQSLVLSGAFCVCSVGTVFRRKTVPCTSSPCTTCVALSCGIGYYQSSATSCDSCNIACSDCTSPVNSAATCSACNSVGYTGNPHTTACFSCFSGCKTCSSTASNACSACLKGYFLYSVGGTCVQTCPPGFFGEESLSLCQPCNSLCSTCVGSNGANYYCLSCPANTFLYDYTCYSPCPNSLYGYQGVCISTCPTTTYPDTSTFKCLSCVANCLECIDGVSCLICSTGAYMHLNVCYVTCPTNFYGSNSTQLCLTCHSSCLTCNGPFSDNCLSCAPSAAALIGGICYATCPSNTYSSVCLSCHSSCLTCSGPLSTNCITCSSPYFFHLNYSQCLATCNLGQLSNNYNFTCTKCPSRKVAYFQACQSCSLTCFECNGITFLECSSCNPGTQLVKSTCVYSNDKSIIFMPNSNKSSLFDAFVTFVIIHFFVSFFLQIIFSYKTNLLQTIQLIQILSYTQFLTIQISQSTQRLAHFLYAMNFSALISINSVTPHPSLPSKFQVIGKTGYFMIDAFGIQIVMVSCSIIYALCSYFSQRSQTFMKIYQKINPYILTYIFRLILLELSLNTMLYMYCFDAVSDLGAASLFLLIVDLFLIVVSLCWRIKTEQQGTQIALFYCNQMGQSISDKQKQYIAPNQQGSNSLQQKIKKGKILPGIMQVLLKVPIPITILYFIGNQSTQTICFFIYFCFYLLLAFILPIRRKVFRLNLLLNSIFLVINALGGILVAKGKTTSYYFQCIWFTILILLFSITVMQMVSNYHFFIEFFSYLKFKVKNWGKASKEEANKINDSNSNLPSDENQSVIFEKANKKDLQSQGKKVKKYLQEKDSNFSQISEA